MRKMLLLSIWLLSVTRCYHQKVLVYSGQEGGLVHIYCPYDSGYETYPKYFLKGDYAKRETVIKTTDKMCKQTTEKRKYDLCDDTEKRILHVTIYNLDLRDNGTYWCEIDAYMYDPKIEVHLKVHKAPAPVKPQPVPLNPPIQTTVEAITMTQQQSARTTVTVGASVTTVGFTTSEDVHTAPLAGKWLYLVMAAAALLLVLLLVLYLRLRSHRRDTARVPVTTGSSDIIYATVTSRRGRDAHGSVGQPLTSQTQRTNPVFSNSISSSLQDSFSAPIINQHKNICSSSTDRDQHTSEDDSQPRRQLTLDAGTSVVYATIKHPKN
ncbi:CMRF35-like molecule 3 isoform X1 [Thunnus albacares]|uniref:CMRF35-like molecule 3 isoform X1 n=1 Tax=Thunnus albacares TaxID=8236 RepID=UPI001CF68828|nr:CMRF35-like molecule 3 isoform X1 [Thunnus albacares]